MGDGDEGAQLSIQEYVEAWEEWRERWEAERIAEMDEYYNRPHDVQCDICDVLDTGSEHELRGKGWALFSSGEFCPSH